VDNDAKSSISRVSRILYKINKKVKQKNYFNSINIKLKKPIKLHHNQEYTTQAVDHINKIVLFIVIILHCVSILNNFIHILALLILQL